MRAIGPATATATRSTLVSTRITSLYDLRRGPCRHGSDDRTDRLGCWTSRETVRMITADRMERVGPVGRRATLAPPCGETAQKDRRPSPCSHDRRPAACAPVAPASAPASSSTREALAPSPALREALITRKRRVQGSGPSPAGFSPRAPKGVMPLGPTLY